jgi:NAD(P)-dependent dehydrogenase (short-subunit alcohol dehydrogenase family)
MSSPEDVDQLVASALDLTGRVDVLVNNAGVVKPQRAEVYDLDHFRYAVDVNLTGLFQLTSRCGRHMIEAGSGSVVSIASILGLVGSGQVPDAAYAATKGAVIAMTRELGVQWARRGVRVNAIAPGWFPTEMSAEMLAQERGKAFIENNTPMARAGLPHELDGALLFLASDASSFVTGQTLVVDGGWTAR